jgi:hypothetical protein
VPKKLFFASSDCFLEEEKEDWMEVLKRRHDIQYNGTQLNGITITNGTLSRGAQKLKGEKLKVVWAEFSTLSWAVLSCMQLHGVYEHSVA